nr:DUF1326 domain-containing protein [Rubrobacter calidifluminis]
MLEVCNCNVLCPCWIGEDPDNGTCDSVLAYHFDKGTIDGVDVSGRTFAALAYLPGNVLDGNWRVVAFVDDEATDEQQEALLNVFTGRLGGPLADLVQLIGEVVAVERAPITFTVEKGRGTLRVGSGVNLIVEAEMASYMGATEKPTTLQETIFSTIPGSPAYVSKATRYRRNSSAYGLQDIDIQDNNAIQGHFHFEAA